MAITLPPPLPTSAANDHFRCTPRGLPELTTTTTADPVVEIIITEGADREAVPARATAAAEAAVAAAAEVAAEA